LVQVELKKNPTCRSRLTSYGQTDGWTVQSLYARGHKKMDKHVQQLSTFKTESNKKGLLMYVKVKGFFAMTFKTFEF
jgi:hypothetical protein